MTVDEIFRAAGWAPGFKDGWDGRFQWRGGNVVGGVDPWGTPRATGIVDNPLTGPNTPEEAAAWLVEHARQLRLEPLDGALEPEQTPPAMEGADDEAHGETGAEAVATTAISDDSVGSGVAGSAELAGDVCENPIDAASDDAGGIGRFARSNASAISDVDFTEAELGGVDFAALTGPDLGAEVLDEGQADPLLLEAALEDFAPDEIKPTESGPGAFIFGDNLDQKRTAAIGLVVQLALERMPVAIDYARLSELRNFAMGVAEDRWPDDPEKRNELDALEGQERKRRQVEAVRDEKVAFLVRADREQIEGFNPEEGWP